MAWCNNLSTQKKNALFGSIICVLVFLYIVILIMPINSKITSLKNDMVENRVLKLWVTKSIDIISEFHKIPRKSAKDTSLLALLDQDTKTNPWGGSVTELKQINDNQVQVSLNNVDFDELINALEQLWGKYAIQVVKISVQHTGPTNLIATIIFSN
jgi:type II secretory pathway component PulM